MRYLVILGMLLALGACSSGQSEETPQCNCPSQAPAPTYTPPPTAPAPVNPAPQVRG